MCSSDLKGRPAHTVHVLCDVAARATMADVLLRETGALGLRGTVMERWPQVRHEVVVHLNGHPIRVKVSEHRRKVEFDDALAAANALGVPVREVLQRAALLTP